MPVDICTNCATALREQDAFMGAHRYSSDCIAALKTKVAELERELAELRRDDA